jgi:pyridoxine 4-dehydrogenase
VANGRVDRARAGVFDLAGKTVHRLGFGAMRLAGPGVWGPPVDRANSVRVARRAVELGINFIDTADSYGFGVTEEILSEALHPYPGDLLIATKAGQVQTRPREWVPVGRPEYLRQQCELSLRRLKLDRIDLFQLHRVDPVVSFEDQIGELKALRDEGKIGSVGLSEVTVGQIETARSIVEIVSVQNVYNLAVRKWDDVVDYCARTGIAFIPWYPVFGGGRSPQEDVLADVAAAAGATPAQVALAWLLARSEVMLPIPGTSSLAHLEENAGAAAVELTPEQIATLTAAVPTP